MTANLKPGDRPRSPCGFTLLELLVSMVISTLILGILLSVTRAALDSWQVNRERVRAARHAKVALDQMARDFESFQMRSGNSFEWLHAKVDPGVGEGAVAGGDAAQIAFFTAATDRYNGQIGVDGLDMGGDVSAVGYRLVYKDPVKNDAGEFAVFALYRNLVDPDTAFEELLGQENLIEGAGPFEKHMDEAGEVSNFVCENIYDLTVAFLVEYESTLGAGTITKQKRFAVIDTTGEGGVETLRIKGNRILAEPAPDEAEAVEQGRIISVDISLSVITEEAMNAIRDGGLTGEEAAAYAAKNSYRFSKAVPLTHN